MVNNRRRISVFAARRWESLTRWIKSVLDEEVTSLRAFYDHYGPTEPATGSNPLHVKAF